jgi:hypothetical protein
MKDCCEGKVADVCAKRAREVFYTRAPFRDNLHECVVINEAYIETVATVFNNIADGEVLIRLIQVIARSCAETLPRTRVLFKLNMNPEDGFVVPGEAAIIKKILLNEFTVIVLFLDVNCFLVFVINETNEHNEEIRDRQFQDFVFEHNEMEWNGMEWNGMKWNGMK